MRKLRVSVCRSFCAVVIYDSPLIPFQTFALIEATRCFSCSRALFISWRKASICLSYTTDCRCISAFCDSITSWSCFAAFCCWSASCRFSSSMVLFCVSHCFSNSYSSRERWNTTRQRFVTSCICVACAFCACFCLFLRLSAHHNSSSARCKRLTSFTALARELCSCVICALSCWKRASELVLIHHRHRNS